MQMATTSVGLRINSLSGVNCVTEDGIYGQGSYEENNSVQRGRLHHDSYSSGICDKNEYSIGPQVGTLGQKMVNNFYIVNVDELSGKAPSKLKTEVSCSSRETENVIVTPGGDSDVTLEYMDLDEFLHENGLSNAYRISEGSGPLEKAYPVSLEHRLSPTPSENVQNNNNNNNLPSPSSVVAQIIPETCLHSRHTINPPPPSSIGISKQPSMMGSPTASIISERSYGRRRSSSRSMDSTRSCSPDEFKGNQSRRGRKEMVPDNDKDDKYWKRRAKNNLAAKRSRDSRRQREAQISMRTKYLESENNNLNERLKHLLQQNEDLKRRLAKYEQI